MQQPLVYRQSLKITQLFLIQFLFSNTLGSVDSMLNHKIEAHPLGSWLTFEITTMGRDVV